MKIDRRGFIGCMAAASAGCAARRGTDGGSRCDTFVFLSDLHIEGAAPTYAYSKKRLEKTVDEILSMSPLPRGVVCFGDISCTYGLDADYIEAKRILSRLENAGVALHFTLGNHDRRSFFFDKWPRCAENSPVPGRCVSVVDLGSADLVLLDALKGADERALTDMGPVEGGLDDRQLAWFGDFVANAARPFFVGSVCQGALPRRTRGEKPALFGLDIRSRSQMAAVVPRLRMEGWRDKADSLPPVLGPVGGYRVCRFPYFGAWSGSGTQNAGFLFHDASSRRRAAVLLGRAHRRS